MTSRSDWYQSFDHFASIAAILLAGDIQARVVQNGEFHLINVSLIDGGNILWGFDATSDIRSWVYSQVDGAGDLTVGMTQTPWTADAEEVAKTIATFEYEVNPEFPPEEVDLT